MFWVIGLVELSHARRALPPQRIFLALEVRCPRLNRVRLVGLARPTAERDAAAGADGDGPLVGIDTVIGAVAARALLR